MLVKDLVEMPKEKEEVVTKVKNPTIEQLEFILQDKGYFLAPNGELKVRIKENQGYNDANKYISNLEANEPTLHQWAKDNGYVKKDEIKVDVEKTALVVRNWLCEKGYKTVWSDECEIAEVIANNINTLLKED